MRRVRRLHRDGDLSLTETFPDKGRLRLLRNVLPREAAERSLQVQVADRAGCATQAGAEVRVYSTDGALLGTRLVPTDYGYGSQGVVPVHFALTTGAGASASP